MHHASRRFRIASKAWMIASLASLAASTGRADPPPWVPAEPGSPWYYSVFYQDGDTDDPTYAFPSVVGFQLDVASGLAILNSPTEQIGNFTPLFKTGAGTLRISSTNTHYAGAFQVRDGTLQLDSELSLSWPSGEYHSLTIIGPGRVELASSTYHGSIRMAGPMASLNMGPSPVVDSFYVDAGASFQTNALTAGGVGVSGAGANLTVDTLLTANRGLTVSNGGTITAGSILAGDWVQLDGGGTLKIGGVASAYGFRLFGGTLQLANPINSSVRMEIGAISTIDTNGNNASFSGQMNGAGGLVKTGAGTLTLSGLNDYSAGTTIRGGTLQAISPEYLGTGPLSSQGGTMHFTGDSILRRETLVTGANSNLIADQNLYVGSDLLTISDGGTLTASVLAVYNSGALNLNAGGTLRIGSLVGAGQFNWAGGTIQLTSNLTTSAPMALSGASTIDTNGAQATLSGLLSGPGGLTKIGTGTLTLTSANTYSSGTTISAGTILINSNANLGSGTVSIPGGTLHSTGYFRLENAMTITGPTASFIADSSLDFGYGGNGSVAITNGGTLSAATSIAFGVLAGNTGIGTVTGAGSQLTAGTTLYSGYFGTGQVLVADGGTITAGALSLGILGGTGLFNLNPGGTLRIGGTNGIVGGIDAQFNWSGGTLQLTSDFTTQVPLALTNYSSIDTNGRNASLASVLFGTGRLSKIGAGTLTLASTNTYAGGTLLFDGVISVGSNANLGSGPLSIQGGTLHATNIFRFDQAIAIQGGGSAMITDNSVESGYAGIGSITITNGGTLSAATSVAFGSLGSGNGTGTVMGAGSRLQAATTLYVGYLGTGKVSVGDGGTVAAGSLFLGLVGGSGVFDLNAGGTLQVGGANGLQAAGASQFNLAGGTLKVAGGALTTTIPMTLSNASLIDTNSLNATLSGVLSGAGALTKTGAGTLFLTTAHTYTGGTTLLEGTLDVNNAAGSGTGSGPVFITAGSTLTGRFTIAGATQMNGLLLPGGTSVGVANFGGDLTLGPASTTYLQIAGAASFDTIQVGGTLALDGTLVVTTTGGYLAHGTYQLLGWSGLAAAGFHPASDLNLSGASLPPGDYWVTSNLLVNGTITAVPEPGVWGLTIPGLLLAGLPRRRRGKDIGPLRRR